MAIKNMATSVLTRLKAQAKQEGIPFQTALQLFAQEEFLRRLAVSRYSENMILKGGMFIYILTEFDSRPTRDIDFMIRSLHGDLNNIQEVMEEICNINTGNDFITLEILGTEQINIEKKYPGVKTSFMGHINNVRIPFSIDVGIDDVIVPNPKKRKIITRLPDFEAPNVYTYSLESTIAEKFDAILQRMEGTSRMKDFYDIYYLSGIFDFDGEVLSKAIKATLEHRNRALPEDVFSEIAGFVDSEFLNTRWKAFEPAKVVGLEFKSTLNRIDEFLKPVYEAVRVNVIFERQWSCNDKKWMK